MRRGPPLEPVDGDVTEILLRSSTICGFLNPGSALASPLHDQGLDPMKSTTHAPETAGMAAVARVRVQQLQVPQMQTPQIQTLGYGWHSVTSPCDTQNFGMAITNKRPPRRLGMRST